MKIITLEEAYERAAKGCLNGFKRIHPHIDFGNGDGPQQMSEISLELNGGDWYGIAYCHKASDAALLAHAFNMLPEVVEAATGLLYAQHNYRQAMARFGGAGNFERLLKEKVKLIGGVLAKANQVKIP